MRRFYGLIAALMVLCFTLTGWASVPDPGGGYDSVTAGVVLADGITPLAVDTDTVPVVAVDRIIEAVRITLLADLFLVQAVMRDSGPFAWVYSEDDYGVPYEPG